MLNDEQKKLVENHLDYAKLIALKRWEKLKHKYTLDEIESCAFLGLVEAAKNFKKNKNITFKTFANKRINGCILDEFRFDKRFNCKKDTPYELPIVSLNAPVLNESIEFIDLLEDKENYFEALLNNYEVDKLLKVLTDSEREIIEMYFLRDMLQEEIAEILNVNQSTVSRSIKNSLDKLKGCLVPSE